MSGHRCHDYCCDNCVTDFYELTDILVKDIQFLEAKVVYLRYALSQRLPERRGEMLMCDIFSDLAGGYWDNPAYQRYMEEYYDGLDPMDNEEHCRLLKRIARGEEAVRL